MNRAILIGHLVRDVEIRETQTGKKIATFDVAINNGKDQNGNYRPSDFIKCKVWDNQADNMAKYTHKGSLVSIEGSIKNESWDDNGVTKRITYVLVNKVNFLDSKPTTTVQEETKVEETDPFEEFGQSLEENTPW